jgi:hypothetical protein
MTVFLRVNSHRAGHRMDQAIGRHPDYYWTVQHGGCFAEVTVQEFDRIKTIKGITKTRTPREELRRCWSFLP